MTEPGGADCQAKTAYLRWDMWKGVIGPVVTLALAGALLLLRGYDLNVPNPILFFANIIVFSAFIGGTPSGMASVAATLGFALVYWSAPGQLLRYAPSDLERLIVLAVTMPPLGLLVGTLRAAHDKKHRELADQNVCLARELERRTALEKAQRDVEYILRHDLRTPLNGIIAIPELLLGDPNLTGEQRRMLALVTAVGRKMLSQIVGTLELRKIEEGSYMLQTGPCDLVRLLRDNFRILAISGDVEEEKFKLIEHSQVNLETDCRLLDVIMANLLSNALTASDKGFPVVVEVGRDDGHCVISVANNRQVPEEVRQSFFGKYVTAGKIGGTGLGTYSALLMTRALGGDISMETSDRAGTKVTVRIPIT